MKALILAAGRGKRLEPFTTTKPKCMIELLERPVLEHVITQVRSAGITDLVIVVKSGDNIIQKYFHDGSRLGVRISYIEQATPAGEGAAILVSEEYLRHEDSFVVLDSDFVAGEGFVDYALSKWPDHGADFSAIVAKVSDPSQFGIVETGIDGLVTTITEKPTRESLSDLALASVYVFHQSVFPALRQANGRLEEAMTFLLGRARKVEPCFGTIHGLTWDVHQIFLKRTSCCFRNTSE